MFLGSGCPRAGPSPDRTRGPSAWPAPGAPLWVSSRARPGYTTSVAEGVSPAVKFIDPAPLCAPNCRTILPAPTWGTPECRREEQAAQRVRPRAGPVWKRPVGPGMAASAASVATSRTTWPAGRTSSIAPARSPASTYVSGWRMRTHLRRGLQQHMPMASRIAAQHARVAYTMSQDRCRTYAGS